MEGIETYLLTTREVAVRLRKSVYWVQTNRKTLKMPGYRIGREYCFPEKEFEQWLEQFRVGGALEDSGGNSITSPRISLVRKAS